MLELSSNDYVATGTGQYGTDVLAFYFPEAGGGHDYLLSDPSSDEYTGIDQSFIFHFVSENRVEGYTYLQDNFTGEFGNRYSFVGTR